MRYIELTKGHRAIVDDEDFEKLSERKWHSMVQPKVRGVRIYAVRKDYKKFGGYTPEYFRMHRVVLGDIPKTMQVDHINGDTLDNRKINLRIVTNQQNQFNATGKGNRTGFKGVVHMKKETHGNLKKPYFAHIMLNRKNISLGYFATPIEAARAYDKAAKELFGEHARTNF